MTDLGHGTLRVARPTDDLESVIRFYVEGLGLELLGSFEDHDGFSGAMVGASGSPYHLEFTTRTGHSAEGAPSGDHLLVFYLARHDEWQRAIERLEASGHQPVRALNPYWDRTGRTFEDPDGYRVVLQHGAWPPGES